MLLSVTGVFYAFSDAGLSLFDRHNEVTLGMLLFAQQVPTPQQHWKIKHVLEQDFSVFAVAMSPDSREVAAGGILSPDISIWDVERGTPIRQLRGLKGSAQALAYSPDGRFFAAGRGMIGPKDTCVFVFQRGTDNILQRLQPPKITTRRAPKGFGSVESLQYSPDSQFLAVGFNGGAIGIYDTTTGQLKTSIVIPDGLDGPLAYSATGKYVAFGELKKDGTEALMQPRVIQLLDVETGEIVKTLTGHSDRVTALAFSPDRKHLASGTSRGTRNSFFDRKSNQVVIKQNADPIRIWDIETGTLVKELSGHTGMIRFLAFYQGGQYLISGSQDKTLKVWDVARGEIVTTLSGHDSLIEAGAVSADGRYLVSGGTEFVKIWER
jgi:WD40 repeat protein